MLLINCERGRLEIDSQAIKACDAQGRPLWWLDSDTFTIPPDSPLLNEVENIKALLDRGPVLGVRFEEEPR